ncbi:MAG: phosphoenolpyruvate-utilizing N-terminal domain-containing protein [Blautia wexlerae]
MCRKQKEKAVNSFNLYDKALREVGESGAAIFEVHQMMLDDEDYLDSIDNIIRTENVNAEYAVATTGDNFAVMFAQMDDDYMKARAADVKIYDRLVRIIRHDEGDDLISIDRSTLVNCTGWLYVKFCIRWYFIHGKLRTMILH